MVACRQRYGPVFKVWFGHRPWIIVADPELGKRVNYKLINRPRTLGDPLVQGPITKDENKGLFASRDNHWRFLHRIWQPAFYAESVHACAPLMSSNTQKLVSRLERLADKGEPVNIWREVGKLTMSIVGTSAYGVDFHTIEDDTDVPQSSSDSLSSQAPATEAPATEQKLQEVCGCNGKHESTQHADNLTQDLNLPAYTITSLAQAKVKISNNDVGSQLVASAQTLFAAAGAQSGSIYQTLALLAPPALKGLVTSLAHKLPDKQFKKVMAARSTMSAASLQLVQRQRAASNSKGAGDGNASKAPGKKWSGAVAPGSFLGLLLHAREAGSQLTDLSLIMQANTFTLAGYETTANTLTFALFCISTHPEAESKILEEIRAAPRPFHTADLEKQFPYTCACVSEALRLYPPGANTSREVGQEPLQLGDFMLPSGATVMVGTYVMQRDPNLWPRAKEFVPERWLPGNEHLASKNPNAYLPFGSGGRMCIGYRFALQEVRLGLIELLEKLHFEVQWNLMVPPKTSALGAAVGADKNVDNGKGANSERRELATELKFTLCPAGGIWVKVEPRVPAAIAE
eukprot:GHUV01008832.1.p1 GENE.GHUV01008832.1~~GHUV01008832.1.p1  ORF type:complete len:573 (+),score=166.57 GHUV01008832.1:167-1885(+)